MTSQSLTLHRPSPLTTSTSKSLDLSRVVSGETGRYIATELLYRILVAICQRFFNAFEDFAARRLDQFATYLERSKQQKATKIGIVEQLAAQEKEREGFGVICPMTGKRQEPPAWIKKRMEDGRGPPGPPEWVKNVVQKWRDVEVREVNFAGNAHTS